MNCLFCHLFHDLFFHQLIPELLGIVNSSLYTEMFLSGSLPHLLKVARLSAAEEELNDDEEEAFTSALLKFKAAGTCLYFSLVSSAREASAHCEQFVNHG